MSDEIAVFGVESAPDRGRLFFLRHGSRMNCAEKQMLQVIGNIPNLEIAVGDFVLRVGDVMGGRLDVADSADKPWPVPLPTPVEAKGSKPPCCVFRGQPLAELRQVALKGRTTEVTGPSGVGKSTLLRQLIWEDWGDAFPDGLIYESCDGLGPDDILQRLYDQFFETFSRTNAIYRPTRDEIISVFKSKKALIILDQLTLDGPPLEQLCGALPECAILTGSCRPVLEERSTNLPLTGLNHPLAWQFLENVFGPDFDVQKPPVAQLLKPLSGHPLRVWQAVAKLLREPDKAATRVIDSEPEILSSAIDDPQRGETTRRLLRTLAAGNGAAISMDAAEALAADGHRHRLDTALNQLRFEGLVVKEELWVRLAPNLDASASRMLESLRAEIVALMNWFTQYFSDRLDIPIAATVPNAVMVLIRRAFELRLYGEIIDLVRIAEVRWICRGQWDTWRQALEFHLIAAGMVENPDEQAWALNQLALCNLCRSDTPKAMALLESAKTLRERTDEKESAALTDSNVQALLRITEQPGRAY
jgi:hypothetical protein